jgi:hypothetical protein
MTETQATYEARRHCKNCGLRVDGICTLKEAEQIECLSGDERTHWRLKIESVNPGTGHARTCRCDTCLEYWERQQVEPDRVPQPPCDLCRHDRDKDIGPCLKCDAGNDQFTPIHDPDSPMVGMEEYLNRAPKNTALENKPKPSLIPFDICIEYDEPAYQEGLIKYYRESWRKGFPISEMYDAAVRHLEQFFYHMQDYDPDAEKLGIKKHHLAGARFSIACMLQTLRDHPEMDDRGKLFGKKEGDNR